MFTFELTQQSILIGTLNVLHLRKDMAQQKVEDAEDQLENTPTSPKWKSRLTNRNEELKNIQYQINDTQKQIQSISISGSKDDD